MRYGWGNRGSVYQVLAEELEQARNLSYLELERNVIKPPMIRTIEVDGSLIEIEVRFSWRDESKKVIRVSAIANGPSTWKLERIEEAIDLPMR